MENYKEEISKLIEMIIKSQKFKNHPFNRQEGTETIINTNDILITIETRMIVYGGFRQEPSYDMNDLNSIRFGMRYDPPSFMSDIVFIDNKTEEIFLTLSNLFIYYIGENPLKLNILDIREDRIEPIITGLQEVLLGLV